MIKEPLKKTEVEINMAGTAEICAQMYSISREAQDAYALESYKRALAGEKNGFAPTEARAAAVPEEQAALALAHGPQKTKRSYA